LSPGPSLQLKRVSDEDESFLRLTPELLFPMDAEDCVLEHRARVPDVLCLDVVVDKLACLLGSPIELD
jgi:hypothetical protein